MNNRTKQADLILQASNISWKCDTVNVLCPRNSTKLSVSPSAHPVRENFTLHISVLPRLPRENSGVASLFHRLAQLSQDGHLVPSWNSSFSGKSVQTLILHRWCPLWSGVSASFMEWSHLDKYLNMQVLLEPVNRLCITVVDALQCFSGQSPSTPCQTCTKTQSLVFHI